MFTFVASQQPNPGVVAFWEWMKAHNCRSSTGVEICCGKGRNAIWLAAQGCRMTAFDFSETAIGEAKRRQERLKLLRAVDFKVLNAISPWPYASHSFDFVVDCYGTADLESTHERRYALDEALRILRPGGHYFLQIASPEIGFFATRYNCAPNSDPSTLVFPNGKIESIMTESELENWSHGLALVEVQRNIDTTLEICGQTEPYKYFWIVMRAPG